MCWPNDNINNDEQNKRKKHQNKFNEYIRIHVINQKQNAHGSLSGTLDNV